MIVPRWARRFTRLVQRGTEWSFRVSEGWVRTPSAVWFSEGVRRLSRRAGLTVDRSGAGSAAAGPGIFALSRR
jgi:hypothetical protein